MGSGKTLVKGMGGLGAATALSRVFGYVRDAMIVAVFGGSRLTDAFYAALRITNFFRRTAGEGAVNAAFVPAFRSEVEKGKGDEFLSGIFTVALAASAALSLLVIIFAPLITALTASGFISDSGIFHLTVLLTRILSPQIIFIALSAVLQGVLYAYMRFFAGSVSALAFSVSIIVYLLAAILVLPGHGFSADARWLSAAAVAGGAAQFLILLVLARRCGLRVRLSVPGRDSSVWAVFAAMLPALFCSAGDQISMFVDMILASFLQAGSVTAIYNSTRIMQLPLALFGVSAANVALSMMAKNAAQGDSAGVAAICRSAYRMAGFILIPATAAIMLLSLPLVRALFEHGNFSAEQSLLTGRALFYSGAGLCAYGLSKITVMAFYAFSDWKTPLKVAGLQALLETALCLVLVPLMGIGGLTLASSVSAWSGAAALLVLFARRTGENPIKGVLPAYGLFSAAAVVMGCAVYFCREFALQLHPVLAILVLTLLGAAVYVIAARLMRIKEIVYAANLFKGGTDGY